MTPVRRAVHRTVTSLVVGVLGAASLVVVSGSSISPISFVQPQAVEQPPEDDADDPTADETQDVESTIGFDYDKVFVPLDRAGASRFSNYGYGPLEIGGAGDIGLLGDTLDPSCSTLAGRIQEVGLRPVVADFQTERVDGSGEVATAIAAVLDPETSEQAEFESTWRSCLDNTAEEFTVPAATTTAGAQTVYVTQLEVGRQFVDAVTWLEPGLMMVVAAPSLGGSEEIRAVLDPVEPALEVAEVLISRLHDPTRALIEEAYAELAYGPPIPGAEALGRYGYRSELERQTPVPPEEYDPSLTIRRIEERLLGDVLVQVVIWDPEFLNTSAFRTAWVEGINRASDAGATSATREGVREFATSTSEGVAQAHWVSECYTVKIVGASLGGLRSTADEIIAAQSRARGPLLDTVDEATVTEDLGDDADEEAVRDARNIEMCSGTNLAEFLAGDVGIDDSEDEPDTP